MNLKTLTAIPKCHKLSKSRRRQPSFLDCQDHPYQFSTDSDACGSVPPDAEHYNPETESDATVQSTIVLQEPILATQK